MSSGFEWGRGTLDFGSYTLEISDACSNSWYGGTLGNSNPSGTLKITDGSSLIVGAGAPGVTLGVPVVVGGDSSNATFSISSSNVSFPNSSPVTVTVNSGAALNFSGSPLSGRYTFGPSTSNNGNYIKGVGGAITFASGAKYTLKTALWNTGATVQFEGNSLVEVFSGAAATGSRSYYQTGGTTILGSTGAETGAYAIATSGFKMTSGNLYT